MTYANRWESRSTRPVGVPCPGWCRTTGPALEAHDRVLFWLGPAVERFPRRQKFLLDDRMQRTAPDVRESQGHRHPAARPSSGSGQSGHRETAGSLSAGPRPAPSGSAAVRARGPRTQLLVQRGAPLDQANQDGNTALHLAAKGSREDSLAMLLDTGANPRSINGDGLTPLQFFVKTGADEGRIVALLLAGADPNRKTPKGYMPLHVTLKTGGSYGKTEVVEALPAGNADPCIRDSEGYISYPCRVGHENLP